MKKLIYIIALLMAVCFFVACDEQIFASITEAVETSDENNITMGSIEVDMTSGAIENPESTNKQEATPSPETTRVTEDTSVSESTEPHTHSWSSWTITVMTTCTDDGTQERYCICGAKEAQEIPASGHSVIIDAAVSPTCQIEGSTEGKHCAICKEIFVPQSSIEKLEHNIVISIQGTPATCTSPGVSDETKCSICKKTMASRSYIPPLGHSNSDWIIDIEPTKLEAGKKHRTCKVCNAIDTETICALGSVGLEYLYNDITKTYTVSGMGTCTDTEVVIPSYYNGIPVTAIRGNAFRNSNITSVIISEGILYINTNAFTYCNNLKNIKLPQSLTGISGNAFFACTALEEIAIPEAVTTIYDNTFRYCTSLKSITLPKSLKSIGESVFYGCTALEEITIPDAVTAINDNAFVNCTNLKKVKFPNNLTYIGKYAFWLCNSLKNVELPSTVTQIDVCAFFQCESLTSVTLSDSLSFIGEEAFSKCRALTSIKIPDQVSTIEPGAFSGCYNLSSVILSNNLVKIGGSAFSDCNKLNGINLPRSLVEIGGSAFWRCESLTEIVLPDTLTSIGNGVFSGCTSLKKATLGKGITSIPDYMFFSCSSLSNITIPNNITSIGNSAFDDCSKLTSITLPEGITSIPERAFYDCKNLKKIVFPNTLTTIGAEVFHGCTKLTNITFPDSLTNIGDYSFRYCSSLKNIVIPKNVSKIGIAAFTDTNAKIQIAEGNEYYHTNGKCLIETKTKTLIYMSGEDEIVIPTDGSVTRLGDNVFTFRCGVDIDLIIPDCITSIGSSAFRSNANIKSVFIPASITDIGAAAFSAGDIQNIIVDEKNEYYYVDGNCLIETKTGTLIAGFTNAVIPTDGSVTRIGDSAFYYVLELTDITIPKSVTSLGSAIFSSTWLKEINYEGTMAEFNAIEKNPVGILWSGTNLKIHCTDGTITV